MYHYFLSYFSDLCFTNFYIFSGMLQPTKGSKKFKSGNNQHIPESELETNKRKLWHIQAA